MRVEDFIDGKIYFSKVTNIFYKRVKGVLMKFPAYGGADREWSKSAYKGSQTWFIEADKELLKEMRR